MDLSDTRPTGPRPKTVRCVQCNEVVQGQARWRLRTFCSPCVQADEGALPRAEAGAEAASTEGPGGRVAVRIWEMLTDSSSRHGRSAATEAQAGGSSWAARRTSRSSSVQPPYDGAARTLKQLQGHSHQRTPTAERHPRKKPRHNLAASVDAVEIVSDTLRAQVFDGPCAMNAAIEKRTAEQKLREAIDHRIRAMTHRGRSGRARSSQRGWQVSPSHWRCSCRPRYWRSPRTFYDASGRVSGRSTTDSGGSTTIYDASGRVTGRTSTSGNHTTIYDASGRNVGTRHDNQATGQMT